MGACDAAKEIKYRIVRVIDKMRNAEERLILKDKANTEGLFKLDSDDSDDDVTDTASQMTETPITLETAASERLKSSESAGKSEGTKSSRKSSIEHVLNVSGSETKQASESNTTTQSKESESKKQTDADSSDDDGPFAI